MNSIPADDVIAAMPLVMDASQLVPQVLAAARGAQTAELSFLASSSRRLLATGEVVHEVEYTLERVAAERQTSSERLQGAWEERVLPHLRVVPSASTLLEVAGGDPRLGCLSRRDDSDAATGALGLLVAPSVIVTKDKDLLDCGLGESQWELLHALGDLSRADGQREAWGAFASVLGETSWRLGRSLLAAVRRYPIYAAALGAIGVGAYVSLRPELRERLRERLGHRARDVFLGTATRLGELEGEFLDAAGRVRGIRVVSPPADSFVGHCAWALARSSRPMSARAIANRLRQLDRAHGSRLEQDLRHALRGCPAFTEVGRGLWQLGEILERATVPDA